MPLLMHSNTLIDFHNLASALSWVTRSAVDGPHGTHAKSPALHPIPSGQNKNSEILAGLRPSALSGTKQQVLPAGLVCCSPVLRSLLGSPTCLPRSTPLCGRNHSAQNFGILSNLFRASFPSSTTHVIIVSLSLSDFERVGEAEQRVWAGLKYCNDRPVLSHISLVGMPSRRVFMNLGKIRRICSWRRARTIKPLGVGEIVVFRMKKKEQMWLYARGALLLGIPGEVICGAR
ncbi:hypothetical protein EDD16DRAFT_1623263 [Pisolithus croceorrhizus]|nr:hypothetical protein EV401DRAFT_2031995 [Pisolithus croceorrhizus]KAI6107212.1 hypothetical protein EDD16DRAFT_1623263 [Pisolithus croceorrhizus]